ncbi:MAG: hypothetical protein SPL04_07560 [Candidatus Onthomorpha sp.]|nr:hypothetical protein [Candidatus Onthomorpha sp.]
MSYKLFAKSIDLCNRPHTLYISKNIPKRSIRSKIVQDLQVKHLIHKIKEY